MHTESILTYAIVAVLILLALMFLKDVVGAWMDLPIPMRRTIAEWEASLAELRARNGRLLVFLIGEVACIVALLAVHTLFAR